MKRKIYEFGVQPVTILSKEYPIEWHPGIEPYYPINDEINQARYQQYADLAATQNRVVFGGRLGLYRYTDMQDTIGAVLDLVSKLKV